MERDRNYRNADNQEKERNSKLKKQKAKVGEISQAKIFGTSSHCFSHTHTHTHTERRTHVAQHRYTPPHAYTKRRHIVHSFHSLYMHTLVGIWHIFTSLLNTHTQKGEASSTPHICIDTHMNTWKEEGIYTTLPTAQATCTQTQGNFLQSQIYGLADYTDQQTYIS